jgi:hypothetical protein
LRKHWIDFKNVVTEHWDMLMTTSHLVPIHPWLCPGHYTKGLTWITFKFHNDSLRRPGKLTAPQHTGSK